MQAATGWVTLVSLVLTSVFACGGDATSGGDSNGAGGNTTSTTTDQSAATMTTSVSSGGTAGTTGTTGTGNLGGVGGSVSNICPSLQPAIGAACSAEGQTCAYQNCVEPNYRDDHELTCIDGAWAVTDVTSCEVVCPSGATIGTSCDAALMPGPCFVINACAFSSEAYCVDGVWSLSAPDQGADKAAPLDTGAAIGTVVTTSGTGTGGAPPPTCPDTQPVLGSACCPSNYPAWCDYRIDGDQAGTGGAGSDVGFATTIVTSSVVTGSGGDGRLPGAGGGSAGAAPVRPECVTCNSEMVWVIASDCQ